jgi:hypothetical protein
MANTDVTLDSARINPLLNNERAASGGFTHKIVIPYTDIDEGAGSSDTVTVTIGTSSADFIVDKAAFNIPTAFAGTGALAAEVGTDGDPNNFLTSTSVMTAAPEIAAIGAAPVTLAGTFAAAADVIEVLFTNSSSGSPSALTAGEFVLWLGLRNANTMS